MVRVLHDRHADPDQQPRRVALAVADDHVHHAARPARGTARSSRRAERRLLHALRQALHVAADVVRRRTSAPRRPGRRCPHLLLDAREPVVAVGPLEPRRQPPLDLLVGAAPGRPRRCPPSAAAAPRPGTIDSESPAIHSRIGRCGVKTGFGFAALRLAAVGGRPCVARRCRSPAGRRVARLVGARGPVPPRGRRRRQHDARGDAVVLARARAPSLSPSRGRSSCSTPAMSISGRGERHADVAAPAVGLRVGHLAQALGVQERAHDDRDQRHQHHVAGRHGATRGGSGAAARGALARGRGLRVAVATRSELEVDEGRDAGRPEGRDEHQRHPDDRALRDRRQVREPRHQRQGYPRRQVLASDPDHDRQRPRRASPGCDGSPQASKSCRKMSPARVEGVGAEEDPGRADDVERDQPPGVAAQPRRRRLGQPAPLAPLGRASAPRQSPTPWMPPQTTNVHAAPCQRPPSSIVSIRLRYVQQRRAAAAAERDVQVVAQPARERDVPAAPEVLQRLARCRARRSSAGSGSRAAARRRWRCRCSPRSRSRSAPRRRRPRPAPRAPECCSGAREDVVDDRVGQVVGDHDLLEQAADDQEGGQPDVDAPRVAAAARAAGGTRAARTIGPATRCGKNDR